MVGTFFVKEKKTIAAAPMHKLAMTKSNPEPKTVPNRANNPQIPEESNSLTFCVIEVGSAYFQFRG